MKRVIAVTLIITVMITTPCYAAARRIRRYHNARTAEIQRRQNEADEKRKAQSQSKNDELRIRITPESSDETVAITDTTGTDELHISSNEYATQTQDYGAKYSYDEFHTAPKDIQPNDGYKSGGFDELHINENYLGNVYHPDHRGYRIEGFDEFRYVDEM